MKTCSKCKKEFPATVEYFYKGNINGFGEQLLKGRCKSCCVPTKEQRKIDTKKYYERHKEIIRKKSMLKYIENRHGVKLAIVC